MKKNAIQGMSIRTKIIISLVGLSLISLAAVSTIVGYQIHKELKQQATHQLISTVKQKSIEYNLKFQRLAEEAEAVADFASEQLQRNESLTTLNHKILMPWVNEGTGTGLNNGYGSPEISLRFQSEIPKIQRIGRMLKGIASNNNLIADAYFSTTYGIFVGDTDKQIYGLEKREAYTPSKRGWYKLAIEKNQTIWTEPYIGASSGRLMVTVATPVYGRLKKLLGVVGFDVLLKDIKKDVLAIDTGFDGYSLLISNNGKALATPNTKKGNENWDQQFKAENLLKTDNSDWNNLVAEMIKGNIGSGEFKDKETHFLAYAPVNALNASVGLVVTEKSIISPAISILKWIAAIAALISIFALFVGSSLGNSISKPILELTHLINEASTGKTKLEPIGTKCKDELGLLADAFNRLTKSLKIALDMKMKS